MRSGTDCRQFKVHAKGKPLSEEIDLRQIAQTTAGFTFYTLSSSSSASDKADDGCCQSQ